MAEAIPLRTARAIPLHWCLCDSIEEAIRVIHQETEHEVVSGVRFLYPEIEALRCHLARIDLSAGDRLKLIARCERIVRLDQASLQLVPRSQRSHCARRLAPYWNRWRY